MNSEHWPGNGQVGITANWQPREFFNCQQVFFSETQVAAVDEWEIIKNIGDYDSDKLTHWSSPEMKWKHLKHRSASPYTKVSTKSTQMALKTNICQPVWFKMNSDIKTDS